MLDQNYVKGPRVIKNVKQIKFEGVWGKLEAKYCFQRQSWLKHMRQPLELVWNSAMKSSISIFEHFLACIDKIFILGGRLGTRLKLYEDLGSS